MSNQRLRGQVAHFLPDPPGWRPWQWDLLVVALIWTVLHLVSPV